MDKNIFFKLVILALTLKIIYDILKFMGVIVKNKTKEVEEAKKEYLIKQEKLKQKRQSFLNLSEKIGIMFGIKQKTLKYMEYEILLTRLQLNIFDNSINPSQLKGITLLLSVLTLISGVMMLKIIPLIALLLLVSGLISLLFLESVLTFIIVTKDKELEYFFSDFYLLIFSSLYRENGLPLKKTVKNFIESIDYKLNRYKKKDLSRIKEIYKFADTYLKLLTEMTELNATVALRERYSTSARIINFCAIVEQRLKGIENKDRLLTFKQELLASKKLEVKLKEDKIAAKGNFMVKLIYLILVQSIIIAAVANFM